MTTARRRQQRRLVTADHVVVMAPSATDVRTRDRPYRQLTTPRTYLLNRKIVTGTGLLLLTRLAAAFTNCTNIVDSYRKRSQPTSVLVRFSRPTQLSNSATRAYESAVSRQDLRHAHVTLVTHLARTKELAPAASGNTGAETCWNSRQPRTRLPASKA